MLGLKKWKLACLNNDLDLMFPNEAGGAMNYSNMVKRYFQKALKAAELPRIRFRDLRHTYQAFCFSKGKTSNTSKVS